MSANIHPTAIVAAGAELGEGVEIGPYCIVGEHVKLGDRVKLQSHCVVEGHTSLGADCVVHHFANLGGPPHHTGYKGEPTRLIVGARNVIREQVTMHVGTPQGRGETVVGDDGFYMAASHVGHDCVVGDKVILAHSATLGGHVHVEDEVMISGLAAVHQWCRVGRFSFVGGLAAVTKDVIPYGMVWGNHAHLEGLNLVGLKRRNFSRETVYDLRDAFGMLFGDDGTFQERLDTVAETYSQSPPVMEIVDFIRADARRPLCRPEREI